MDENIYVANGYANRQEYIDELKEEFGADIVNTLLTVLPASEDFDGLVTELENLRDSGFSLDS
jgi:hypothetical protein